MGPAGLAASLWGAGVPVACLLRPGASGPGCGCPGLGVALASSCGGALAGSGALGGWAPPWGARASPFLLSALRPLPSSFPLARPPPPLAGGWGPLAAWGSAVGSWFPPGWGGDSGAAAHGVITQAWWGGCNNPHGVGGFGGGSRLVPVLPPLVERGLGFVSGTRWLGALGGPCGLPVEAASWGWSARAGSSVVVGSVAPMRQSAGGACFGGAVWSLGVIWAVACGPWGLLLRGPRYTAPLLPLVVAGRGWPSLA